MLCCFPLLSLCPEPSSLVLLEHLGQVHRCVFSQGVAVHVPLCVRECVHLCVCVRARVERPRGQVLGSHWVTPGGRAGGVPHADPHHHMGL